MSNNNNIYNILNSFNKIAQEPKAAATEQSASPKKTQLEESIEQVLQRKLIAEKKAKPDYIDLDKDGDKKEPMKKAAKDAAKKKEVDEGVDEKVYRHKGTYGTSYDGDDTKKPEAKRGRGRPKKGSDSETGEVKKYDWSAFGATGKDIKLPKHTGAVTKHKMVGEAKNAFTPRDVKLAIKFDGKDPESSIPLGKIWEITPSGKIRFDMNNGQHRGLNAILSRPIEYAEDWAMLKKQMKQEIMRQQGLAEVAPPGDKAERMVKHIKAGYAKDGKLTPKEKGIAYATAWKAHNKGKVEETIKSLIAAGYSKEQIVEGWEEMMKGVEQRNKEEKGTGKFDKEKTDTGTKYTRKYDPKTGESDDTGKDGEGNEVKRGRGRPKKVSESTRTIDGLVSSLFEGVHTMDYMALQKAKSSPLKRAATDLAKKAVSGVGKAVRKGLDTLGHGSDEELLKDLEKRMQNEDELEESLNQMRRIAGLPVAESKKADKDYDGDGKIESGKDEYLGSRIAAAKKAGKLKEGEMCAKCDCDPCECDDDKEKVDECMSPVAGMAQDAQAAAGRMSVSTNVSSDGTKSINISADGNAAEELMQMLKLAGMGGSHEAEPEDEPEGVMVVAQDEESTEEDVEEEKDPRYEASTTPDEHVMPVQTQTKGGDGDVAGKEKQMHKHGYKFSDNPLGMNESQSLKLMKEYESIKIKK